MSQHPSSQEPVFEVRREYKGLECDIVASRTVLEAIGMTPDEFYEMAGPYAEAQAERFYGDAYLIAKVHLAVP